MSAERTWDELAGLTDDTEYGESWIPNSDHADHPNPLLGTVDGFHPATTEDGKTVIVCDLTDRDGKRWGVWLFGKDGGRGADPDSGWFKQFRIHQPRVGERVALRDDGLHDLSNPGTGTRGKVFRKVVLAVDRDRPMELADYMAPPQIQVKSDIPVDAEFDRIIADGAEEVPDAAVVEDGDTFGRAVEQTRQDDDPPPF
jgi:hypothetical protein